MSKVVYGTFKDANAACAALDQANAALVEDDTINSIVHTGHLREEDVQLGGTAAVGGMIIGGLVVGVVGALIAGLAIWPFAGYWFGVQAMALMALCGSIFGVVAGAVAGASECKSSLRDRSEDLHKGAAMVTCEVERDTAGRLAEVLKQAGGTHIEAA